MISMLQEIMEGMLILLGCFLAFFFYRNRNNQSNIWLSLMCLTLALHFLNLILLDKIQIAHFGLIFGLLYGPLFFLFVKSHRKDIHGLHYLHFIPACLLFIWVLISSNTRTSALELNIFQFIVAIHFISYFIFAIKEAKGYREVALQTRSRIDDDKIQLIRNAIITIGLVFIIAILQTYMQTISYEKYLRLAISIIIVSGMLGVIARGMENPHFFHALSQEEESLATQPTQYVSSGLTDENAVAYLEKLQSYMKEHQPYKIDDLSLNYLANATDIPPRYLSQIINQKLGRNFFDYVNSLRISEAQNLLEDKDKRITEIMYEVGFSSRSTFNAAFKKYVHQTPSQYRKSLK